MEIARVKDYEEMTALLTGIFVKQIREKPESVLSFTTGGTPRGLLEALAFEIQNGLDVRRCTFCNLDEYVGKREDSCSVYHFMHEYLYDRIDRDLLPAHIYMMNAEAEDQEAELLRYTQILENCPRDIQLLGLGTNGHIGANEPGTPFDSTLFVADSCPSTIAATASLFHLSIEETPTQMFTMGFTEIMAAERVILAASGESKAEAVKKIVEGEITEEVPASCLKSHPKFLLIIDEAAASKL